jgi:glycerol-3-phosphate dehydrogenase (NAD(P)+)
MNIIILGRGAWGSALGGVAGRLGHQVTFVGHGDAAWPDVRPDYVLVALPVQHVRETLARFPPPACRS